MTDLLKPCIVCGILADDTRCPDHRLSNADAPSQLDKPRDALAGYDTTWRKLSARARKLQPWCSDCYTPYDLTADHSERAWRRKAEGKPIRLKDIDVVCRACNSRRGKQRPDSDQGGEASTVSRFSPGPEAHSMTLAGSIR